MIITNKSDLPVEMAVWLVHNDYDYVNEENYFSATGLMKPLRHILLPNRIPESERLPLDVEDLVSSSMGQALHAGIEKAWSDGRHRLALKKLGFSPDTIDRVLVNPTPEELLAKEAELPPGVSPIPVYIEQRAIRPITVQGVTFKVGGKFDMVCEGRVTDTKSTTVWNWVYGGKDEDYKLQGSIYRWLNPDKIIEDFVRINFIFTDWQKQEVQKKPGYPAKRLMHKDIPLMSLQETEDWIRAKLTQILNHEDTPENLLPECSDEELWLSDPKHKYYANPANVIGKSTKNFDDLAEAQAFMREKGKGIVITVPGTPKRCGYCNAFLICTQKDKYNHD